ncbi:MAG: hypothetical protein QOK16_2512, partial [Solirubrobacteraceae bacterium]|nr:hypothetical protein [Solirubrobacteraceae bacterium]
MRSTTVMLVLLVSALVPASAFAVAPTNDTQAGATPLRVDYSSPTVVAIPPDVASGGWAGATTTEDSAPGGLAAPSCLRSPGYYSMWYRVDVPEASVLMAALQSNDNNLFRPLISIIGKSDRSPTDEFACALAGNALGRDTNVSASSYVPAGTYFIRIASASNPNTDVPVLPTLQLTESLRDVTPPQIRVHSSKTVGVGKPFTFDATASTDSGSGVDLASASWLFRDSGGNHPFTSANSATPEVATYTWKTTGFHLVTVTLADKGTNKSTYSFNVFVHSFVPPKVSMRVVVPKPGVRQIRILLTHDQPVRVRLVVLQAGAILRTVPSKAITGSRVTTSVTIPLLRKVAKTGYVF